MESTIFRFVLRYSRKEQILLVLMTLSAFPFLYVSLDLPKTIINEAIGGKGFPKEIFGYTGPDWKLYGDGMVKGNSLLLNDGQGRFVESSEVAGTNPYGWYWGSSFLDFDNDGRLDIYAANGWISGKTHDDL